MKKLLTFIVLTTIVSLFTATAEPVSPDARWLDAASRMIQRGETVRTPLRYRVTFLVQWARHNNVEIVLTNPSEDGSSYSIVAK
jgi:hypothetical protein